MKKILISLLAMSMLSTVAFAAEDTVDTVAYGDTTYVYGGSAVETTDDNENGRLDGLLLRGVDTATYYSAGDGFIYFTPATEETAALMIFDNATLVADYCFQAVTDLDVILVGDNHLENTSTNYFTFAAVEAYDENMEVLDYEDYDYGAVTIDGTGSLTVKMAGYTGLCTGAWTILNGDVIIDMGESDGIAMEIHGDFTVSGGSLAVSGGTDDSVGAMVIAYADDVSVAIIGGATTIENNGTNSMAVVKYTDDVTVNTLVDFTDAPDGVFVLEGYLQFYDVVDIYAETGAVDIFGFDALTMETDALLTVVGLSDYIYTINEMVMLDQLEQSLVGFAGSIVGQPDITWRTRTGLVFPYTTGTDSPTEFTFTRAQVIALLWDSMGCPEAAMNNPFVDVSAEDNYYQAIMWAVEQGVTTGTTATTFDPDALCTKGQLLTFLYRNAGEPEVDVENLFANVEENSYLYDAVLWGIANAMMDVEAERFDSECTLLNDGAIGYLLCM